MPSGPTNSGLGKPSVGSVKNMLAQKC
jgi:hypothetical protein